MKWLSILKSKSGKFVLNAPALAASVAIGAGAWTLFHNVGTNPKLQPPVVRSILAIADPYNYQGMQQSGQSGLTSIQVRDGLNQIATQRDLDRQARQEAAVGDFGIDAAEGVENRFAFGSAAKGGATEGLGMGANDLLEVPSGSASGSGAAVVSRVPQIGSAAAQQADGSAGGGATGNGSASGNQLVSASMARASGGSVHSAAGAQMGGSRAMGSNGQAGNSGYEFSGAMPGSSSAVSSLADSQSARLGSSSRFVRGGRQTNITNGGRSQSGRGDIYEIAKRSAHAAKNKNRSANEGSRAFLDGAQKSGGMTIEGETGESSAESSDFETPLNENLSKLKGWGQQAEDDAAKREKAHKRMMDLLLYTVLAALTMLPLASFLLSKPTPWTKALGYVLCAGVGVLAGFLIAAAASYSKDYGASTSTGFIETIGVAVIIGAGYVALTQGKVWKWLKPKLGGVGKQVWNFIGMPFAMGEAQNLLKKK